MFLRAVGIRLGQLFPNIVLTLVINSRSPTLDQHLTDCHSGQSVMISVWAMTFSWHIFLVQFIARFF